MKYAFLLLLLTCPLAVFAQGNCPDDEVLLLPPSESTTDFLLKAPEADNCETKQGNAYVLTGAVIGAGDLSAATTVSLPLGRTNVRYYNCTNVMGKTLDEPFPLPDGTGANYSIPFVVSGYPDTSRVATSGSPIVICATMEHSYLGDLDIWVTCPEGNIMDLHTFRQGNGVSDQLLGFGDRNTTTPDSSLQYCWRLGASRTITQYVNDLNVGEDETLPAGDYAPENGLGAVGDCRVNGEWNLHFRDNLAVDNGSVAAWSVAFSNGIAGQCDFAVEVREWPVSASGPPLLPGLQLAVAPNPFTDELGLRFTATQAQHLELRLFSAAGKSVLQRTVSLVPGAQTLTFSAENWSSGAYYIHLRTEAGTTFRKLIRQ